MNTPNEGSNGSEEVALSFVIPVKDEEATLKALFQGVARQANMCASRWEIIFVDDGSTDHSWNLIKALHERHPGQVKGLRFRRNLGKASALAAGWSEAKGNIVFTMDADLQDDPMEIPRFLDKINEGYDVVTGWKRTRHDPWHKVLPSRIFNFVLSRVSNVYLHDHNCGFKCYRRCVIRTVSMYGEMHRMVPSLAAMYGFRTAEIPVRHHPRRFGKSKYGWQRFVNGFLDMWTVYFLARYRERPMHLIGIFALSMAVLGLSLPVLAVCLALPLTITVALCAAGPICLVGAITIAAIGLIAELAIHDQAINARALPISESIVHEADALEIKPSQTADLPNGSPSVL